MKKKLAMIFAACLMLSLTACGNQAAEETQEQETEADGQEAVDEEATLVIPSTSDIESLNYLQVGLSDNGETMLGAVYDPLYRVMQDGSIKYYLADSVEMNDEMTELVIKLKDGIKWHDGETLDTDDVMYTFNALQSGTLVSGFSVGTTLNGEPVSIEKVDNLTVKLTLPAPSASYLNMFGGFHPLPEHRYADLADPNTDEENQVGIGNGPYKVKEHIPGEKLVLERNDDYYRGKAHFAEVEYKIIPETTSQEIALQNGEINFFKVSDQQTLEKYKADENYSVAVSVEGRINYLGLNKNSEVMSDIKAREAVVKALNIEEIVAGVYGSDEIATACPGGVICAGGQYYDESLPNYEQDVEEAKTLAEESGLTDKTVRLLYNTARAGMEDIALIIQQQCQEAGINVELVGMDSGAMLADFFDGNATSWDIGLNGFTSGGNPVYARSFFTTTGYYAANAYVTEEVDECWLKADTLPTEEERQEAFAELNTELQKCYSFVPISSTNRIIVTQKDYKGFEGVDGTNPLNDYLELYKVQ